MSKPTPTAKPSADLALRCVRLQFQAEGAGIVDREDGLSVEGVSAAAWRGTVATIERHAALSAKGGGLCSDGRGVVACKQAPAVRDEARAILDLLAAVQS